MKTQAGPPNGRRHNRRRKHSSRVHRASYGASLSTRESQTTAAGFTEIFEVGVATFYGNRDQKEDPFGVAVPSSCVIPRSLGQALGRLLSFALGALTVTSTTPKQSLKKSTLIMAWVVG